MTGKTLSSAAKKHGYEPTNYLSNNEKVFYNKKTKTYITQDIGGPHNGGVWKMAKTVEKLGSRDTRMGTYDANLDRIGD